MSAASGREEYEMARELTLSISGEADNSNGVGDIEMDIHITLHDNGLVEIRKTRGEMSVAVYSHFNEGFTGETEHLKLQVNVGVEGNIVRRVVFHDAVVIDTGVRQPDESGYYFWVTDADRLIFSNDGNLMGSMMSEPPLDLMDQNCIYSGRMNEQGEVTRPYRTRIQDTEQYEYVPEPVPQALLPRLLAAREAFLKLFAEERSES